MEDKKASRIREFLRKHRYDLVLILLLVFISLIILLAFNLTRKDGAFVEVTVDGEHYAKYSLGSDGEYPIGDGNVLVIEDGWAYMRSADCPDRTCVNKGKIRYTNQTIVCLPNRVAVKVISGEGGVDLES